MFRMSHGAALGALISLAGVLPAPAFAHVSFEKAEAVSAASWKGVLRVPHGCEGEATRSVSVTIPAGVIDVKPMPKAGWTLATKTARYATTYALHGREVSEGVSEIVWSGGDLPDGQYDEFTFVARIESAESTLSFPTLQVCATKQAAWTEIAAPGQDPHALKAPAPRITLAQASPAHGSHQHAQAPASQGDLKLERAWTRATPNGAPVAGGYVKITNTGAAPDRLIGGAFAIAKRFEVHEMATVDGVMKMRALSQGLVIPPGESVELKPGSYHMMLMELTGQIKAGDRIKGTLTFEKAGPIEVELVAAPIGASAPGGHAH